MTIISWYSTCMYDLIYDVVNNGILCFDLRHMYDKCIW